MKIVSYEESSLCCREDKSITCRTCEQNLTGDTGIIKTHRAHVNLVIMVIIMLLFLMFSPQNVKHRPSSN